MTTIDELGEMEFVDWDAALVGTSADPVVTSEDAAAVPLDAVAGPADGPNMDLVFGDVDGDDWSYWALEHFESTQMPQDNDLNMLAEPDPSAYPEMYWETPEVPCTHCAAGGYQCKRIREGKYKGYCTTCVALRCECSISPSNNNLTAEAGATFPANPWVTMGDRPETSILHEDELAAIMTSAPSVPGLVATAGEKQPSPKPQSMPKIGARFSRESVKILKNWVSTHSRHPYPTEDEKEGLQKLTGLNKTQITNWLANARRRGKIQPTRATSPHIGRGYVQAIDIPQRRGTLAQFENMNPLQRWANSPPENEPASVAAIARAVSDSSTSYSQASGSGRNSPYVSNYSDDGSSRSLCNQSSASSLGTSHSSGGSFASAYSNKSLGSFGSLPSFARARGRRRRRRAPPRRADEGLSQPLKTFQCTFCTETFRTKHDWQRHEKSLHLSLERWICSPDGPRTVNPENGLVSCVFCGEANPNDAHVESHNFSGCTERAPEERTFYRKDHLRQHLKLVHDVKFVPWSMEKWRIVTPEIRSRCGFCGIVLDSWTIRVDHLAEHFKTGNTMADWKGDWGFEAPVLEMVENSIPPYLIHDERNTPLPFAPAGGTPSSPNNAYELLKLELRHWIAGPGAELGREITDADIQLEACCIVFGAESQPRSRNSDAPSWLRDLIMSSEEQVRQAAFRPIRSHMENRVSGLRVNGRDDIFEQCELERQLQDFVKAKQLLGLTAMDHELQVEACRVVGRMEETSRYPMDDVADWLLRRIHASPRWLAGFRQRAHLPRSEDVVGGSMRSKDPRTIDSTVHNYSRLERELAEYLAARRAAGAEPDDADLQRQARIIIYDTDDEWNQTAADDSDWLLRFRQRHPAQSGPATSTSGSSPASRGQGQSPSQNQNQGVATAVSDSRFVAPLYSELPSYRNNSNNAPAPGGAFSASIKTGPYFINDTNCYRRLAQGLSRFVASTMSPNNPNRHVPTDEEMQYQARWLIYDDDDPWNQTAADNFEWLQRFKRDVGILPADGGPGLGAPDHVAWAPSAGGTGFAPPYVAPNPTSTIEALASIPAPAATSSLLHPSSSSSISPSIIASGGNNNSSSISNSITTATNPTTPSAPAAAATRFLRSIGRTARHPPPAKVFCSRELEAGLASYVRRETLTGAFPSDDALRERARHIMGMQKTSCDDPALLERFKAAVRADIAGGLELGGDKGAPLSPGVAADIAAVTATGVGASSDPLVSSSTTATLPDAGADLDMNMDFQFTAQEMDDMLQDLSPDFGSGGGASLNPSPATSGASAASALLGPNFGL
ncbi:hypothetical protein GGR52DRAFT_157183 [Hypoxylon sp. FL1284]|nr:hypothetical protein GGR52DRAFT_157183 [Hypoxylon sp. FL1284]